MRKKLFFALPLFIIPISLSFILFKILTFLKRYFYWDITFLIVGVIVFIAAIVFTCKYLNRLIYNFTILDLFKLILSVIVLYLSFKFIKRCIAKIHDKILNMHHYFVKNLTLFPLRYLIFKTDTNKYRTHERQSFSK